MHLFFLVYAMSISLRRSGTGGATTDEMRQHTIVMKAPLEQQSSFWASKLVSQRALR